MLFLVLMKLHRPTHTLLPCNLIFWGEHPFGCVARMAMFSIGTHLSLFQHLRNSKLPLHGLCTVEPPPFFGSSSCRTRFTGPIPTLLRRNVLARAEDKARDPTSSLQTQQSSQSQVLASFSVWPSNQVSSNTLLVAVFIVYDIGYLMLGCIVWVKGSSLFHERSKFSVDWLNIQFQQSLFRISSVSCNDFFLLRR